MLKRQLYLVYIISVLVPIMLIGGYLIQNNYRLIYQHHQDMLISDNLRVRSIIFEVTTSITNVCDSIAEDPGLADLLSNRYESWEAARSALESFTTAKDYYERHTDISSIKIYTVNETLHNYGHIERVTEDNGAWFEDNVSRPSYYWSTYHGANNFDVPYVELQLVHRITLTDTGEKALIVITVSGNYLKNRIDNNELDVDLSVNSDPIFYSTWKQADKKPIFNDYDQVEYYRFSGNTEYLGKYGLLEASTFKPIKADDQIFIFSSDFDALPDIQKILIVMILIVGVSTVIPTLVILKYTRQLTTRVDTLRTEMHRVTGGDYNIIETFKGNDELAELFADLKYMISSIKERDQAIFDGKIKEQQLINHQQTMEMELLSSKINPHFLYNTLETIRMKAFANDDLDVANAVKLLGKYMRYNLESTGEMTTLQSELSYIEIYLGIQKLRFTSKINYTIEVDDSIETDNIKILPLLIQPIVENAILHGHEETIEDGRIDIQIMDMGDSVKVEVSDNGCGMDDITLNRLRFKLEQEEKPTKTSFGLYNIHQRLKLYYGEAYGLSIESEVNLGTVIDFILPKSPLRED